MLELERLDPLKDPIQQFQLVAAEIIKLKDVLGDMVWDLPSWTYEDLVGREDLRAVVNAYGKALDRSLKVLTEMLRLDLGERLVNLSSAQAAIMIRLMESVILAKEMGLTGEQVQIAKTIVAREIPSRLGTPSRGSGSCAKWIRMGQPELSS
jgi:hypothetical protein